MSERKKTEFIVLTESVRKSWARDASTFTMFIALISIGIAMESVAMQIVGGIIGFLTIMVKASGIQKSMTHDEAIAHIQRLKAEVDA